MKKLMSLILAMSMVMISVIGCGASTETATETTTETATETTTETATDVTTEDGAATIKIGGIGPISGAAAVYGIAVKNGAQLAVDEINAAGGINGVQIEFNFQDDEHDAEKAINAYNTLKDWGMQMLMGTVTSTPCIAVADLTNTDNMFQLTPSGSAVACTQYPNAFRVCFSDPMQGTAAAQYIGMNSLATKVAVIYNSSDVYSTGIYEKFQAEAANQNFEIVSAEAFTDDSKSDFSVQIQKAKDAGAELVFLPIYYDTAALILGQAKAADYSPMFFGCDGLDGILSVEGFDTALAENVMLLTPFAADATDELTVNFVNSYVAAFGETPNQFAADAYDAIYIMKAAAEAAAITPDMSVSDITEAMKTAMTTITIDGTTGLGMTWTVDGEVNKSPKAVKIVDGVYVAM